MRACFFRACLSLGPAKRSHGPRMPADFVVARMGLGLLILYVVLVVIVLVNMLIAIVSAS